MGSRASQHRYTVDMAYLDQKRGKSTTIKNECIKFIVIDHNYDVNHMPIVYISMKIDKKILDDMILNCNTNLIMLALNKYDDLTNEKQEVECFRKKFTYFLPNDVNKNDAIDYTDSNVEEHLGNTYRNVTIGLLAVDHINSNKRSFNFLLKNASIGTAVKEVVGHFNNLIMEPIGDPRTIENLMLPPCDSVSSALKYLNNINVFYDTQYRYYQDFNNTYLLSSNPNPIDRSGDVYTSVIFEIQDILDKAANDIGIIINRDSKTYQIPVNYVNTEVYDNSIINKTQSDIISMDVNGHNTVALKNKASYMDNKTKTVRVYNNNTNSVNNIKTNSDNNNFLVYIQKTDLDTDVLSLNKRITIHHIDRYKEHDGDYLMYRKRECFVREDTSFLLNTMVNLRQVFKV